MNSLKKGKVREVPLLNFEEGSWGPGCSTKYVFLKIWKIQGKAPMLESLFNKVTGLLL